TGSPPRRRASPCRRTPEAAPSPPTMELPTGRVRCGLVQCKAFCGGSARIVNRTDPTVLVGSQPNYYDPQRRNQMAAGRLAWPRVSWPVGPLEEVQLFSRRRDAVVLGSVALAILLLPVRDLILGQARLPELWAHDFGLYLDAASRWLGGG